MKCARKAGMARIGMGMVLSLSLSVLPGCALFGTLFKTAENKAASDGGGETVQIAGQDVNPADVKVPEGYRIEAVARGFTFPTSVLTDDQNRLYVVEAGYSYGERYDTPRLVRVEPDGKHTVIAEGDRDSAPWTGAAFHQGAFIVSAGGNPGRILRVTMDGKISQLLGGIPSKGDHHTNHPVVGPDGWIYFGQGAITNSGVVGMDNVLFGWLLKTPELHDIPGMDITLAGENFTTPNPLSRVNPADKATTGAFMPFGKASTKGQVVKAGLPCHSSIMRMRPDGTSLQLVAWGIRNPFGLGFSPDGRLFATDNQFDARGSRPIENAPDLFVEVKRGVWYGFPDYVGNVPVTDPRFKPANGPQPKFLLAKHPNVPPKPAADLGAHTASHGFDFSRKASFGYAGQAFVAQFGDAAPATGQVDSPKGFKVVRVDPATGKVEDFLSNKAGQGPASKIGGGGLERPIDVHFDRPGEAMYVLDFGIMTMPALPNPRKDSGVLWRVTRAAAR